MPRICLLALLALAALQAHRAVAADIYSELLAEAESRQLDQQPGWLKLLVIAPETPTVSAIHSPEFFLSPPGHNLAQNELKATLAGILKPLTSDADQHPQCRFPARTLWLQAQLPALSQYLPAVECQAFQQWSMGNDLASVSIVFATGYLGNPASYYGHILLKLNSRHTTRKSKLLDTTINFGAIIPANEDPLTYIVKGISGGYEAGFTRQQYYLHTRNYGENEFRDLWEYPLDLPLEATNLIVAHAWEVLGKKYTYYFASKNCADRMAELLEVVPGIKVKPKAPWVIPQQFIKALGESTYQGQPLVTNVSYVPSRQTRLYAKHRQLTGQQKRLLKTLVNDPTQLDKPLMAKQTLVSQQQLLDTLLDYYEFVRDPESETPDQATLNYNHVLAKRYQLVAGSGFKPAPAPTPPHKSRSASLIQISAAHNSNKAEGVSLRLRPAYYDPLDADTGHVAHAELAMADISFQVFGDQAALESLKVISIQSQKNYATGLPGDNNQIWKLQAGWRPASLGCEDHCLQSYLSGDIGYSWQMTGELLMGAYVGLAAQENREDQGHGYSDLSSFISYDWRPDLAVRLEYEKRFYPEANQSVANNLTTAVVRYQPTSVQDWDLRLSYTRQNTRQIAISLGYYW